MRTYATVSGHLSSYNHSSSAKKRQPTNEQNLNNNQTKAKHSKKTGYDSKKLEAISEKLWPRIQITLA